MKILMVSSFLPYPLFSGGHIRLYNILKNISKNNQLTLICEKRDYQTDQDIKEVKKVCHKLITVPKKLQWTISNVLKSGFSLNPFLVTGHTNSLMREKISEELKQKFDLIHVETFYVMQNLAKTSLPVVLVEHNVEYLVYERYAKQASIILRPLLYLDVWKLKRSEEYFWKKATKLISVSNREKEIMNADEVIPNGVDIEKFKLKKNNAGNKEKTVLFIGDFRWIENRDSIEWILKDIWPEIKFKVQSSKFKVKLWIVGKRIPDKIKKITSDPDVVFDENAPLDTHKIYEKSFVLLSPIRVGGGTSFKILESMASGVPVVTTSLGTLGIGALDRIHVLTSENSKGFANNIVELLSNKSLYESLVFNARKFVEENYSWDEIANKLNNIYKSLV